MVTLDTKKHVVIPVYGFKKVTPRMRRVLLFVHEYKSHRDYSPSFREIIAGTGIPSTSVVRYYLNKLRANDLLDWVDREARTIHLTDTGKELVTSWLRVEKPELLQRRVTDKKP